MFDISNSNQSEAVEASFKALLYKSVHNTSHNARWIRFAGLGIGIVAGMAAVARQVALIAENIIKGLGNIFGHFFSQKCNVKTGLKQLFFETPKNIIILPFTILNATIDIFVHTVKMGSNPINYSYNKLHNADPIKAKENSEQRVQQELLLEKQAFDQNMQQYQQNPNDLKTILNIATAYKYGDGVKKDPEQWIHFLTEAAKLNDVKSVKLLAYLYKEGIAVQQDNEMASQYYLQAANLNDTDYL